MTTDIAAAFADANGLDLLPTEDGAQVLDDVRALLSRFVSFPDEDALTATALWAAHTHALDAFDTSPRLAFLSPEPGSGKTRALEILELLVLRPLLTVNVTPAYLFRKVSDEAGPPTLLYDEIDTVFGPKAKDNEDIRGMLNSGYRKGATAGRCVIKGKSIETEELPSYAAVALAGLDDLPDTIATRSIVMRMRRRAPHEVIASYRRRTHEAEGHELRDRLAAWVEQSWAKIDGAWPDLPDGIEDRSADVWEPLLALADAAGGTWPEVARQAAVAMVGAARDTSGSLGVRLLADLRSVFQTAGADKMATEAILDALQQLDEAPWGDLRGKALDARGLSRRLGKYDVRPKQVRLGDRTLKGYDVADLADAWARYLTATPGFPVSLVSPAEGHRGADVPLAAYSTTKSDPTHPAVEERTGTTAPLSGQAGETSETPEHRCRHGMPGGDHPDRFVGGRVACPQCRLEATGRAS